MEPSKNKVEGNHHLVSPTAKMVAYMRAQSDIPYSAEIARLTDSENATNELLGIDGLEWWMGAMLELRYKSLQALIEKEGIEKGIRNIFEMASGILPRGILMTEREDINYIETDLPDMAEEKRLLLKELKIDTAGRHLAVEDLNVLEGDKMRELCAHFPAGPICFANEGLLMYLTVPEKEIVAKTIHAILKERGGLWITPDLSNSDRMRDIFIAYPELAVLLEKINKSTGKDMRANAIGNDQQIADFFQRLGFRLTEYRQKDLVDELSVLKDTTSLDDKKKSLVDNVIDSAKVWVLRAI